LPCAKDGSDSRAIICIERKPSIGWENLFFDKLSSELEREIARTFLIFFLFLLVAFLKQRRNHRKPEKLSLNTNFLAGAIATNGWRYEVVASFLKKTCPTE
jgi:hypothetical protein